MATTSPDNLFSPNPSDNYNLIADWATSMQSVQAALVKRGNMYVGTSAQRTAFTSAPEGVHWQDTNGTKYEYVRKSGVWAVSVPVVSGSRSGVSVPANTVTSVDVTLPTGFFSVAPTVILSPRNPVGWSPQPNFRVLSQSPTSFTVQVFSTASRTEVAFDWVAVAAQ